MSKIASPITVTMHGYHPTVEIQNLPIGGCFIDKYDIILMRLKPDHERFDLEQCVVLNGKDIGVIKEYSRRTLVRFVDAKLEIYQ